VTIFNVALEVIKIVHYLEGSTPLIEELEVVLDLILLTALLKQDAKE
jgi:hypothetical protein